jgi:hypothetical protein
VSFLPEPRVCQQHGPHCSGHGTFTLPVVADPSMPPGYFEMRSGEQRVGAWLPEAREYHDPGDEDRSER